LHFPSIFVDFLMTVLTLILASTSVYRKELLARLRYPFETVAPAVDETPLPAEAPAVLALRLAQAKAREVACRYPEAVVIGSDQVAELQGQVLGKPLTHDTAVVQLQALSGQTATFYTAACVMRLSTGFMESVNVVTRVSFRLLTLHEIERYLSLEPALDCAGSAKCEGLGITLMRSIEGDDPTALIGLPLIRTTELLRQVGVDPLLEPLT
jgi:septum formation protein